MKLLPVFLSILVVIPAVCLGEDEAAQSEAEVLLDPGIMFTLTDGEKVEISGGIYQLRAAGPGSLSLRSGDEVYEIEAETLELEEGTLGTDALSFEDEAGVQHLVIAQPDGSVLSSIGRKEPEVQLRGTTSTAYVTADRVKAIAIATAPVRISRTHSISTVNPRIEVLAPVKDDKWIHGNEYRISWRSTDGRFVKVGDEVKIQLVRTQPGGGNAGWPKSEPNDGTSSFTPGKWTAPGQYQVVVTSAANATIIGKSQPFSVWVTEPCQTGGTLIKCHTVWVAGVDKELQTYIGPAPPGYRSWLTVDTIYKERRGSISYNRSSDGGYYLRVKSGGWTEKVYCGFTTCTNNYPGLFSATVYLHATK